MKLFLSPHNDDAVLFGAFTVQRERPLVMTIFDSHIQGQRGHRVTAEQRRAEDRQALRILGVEIEFAGISDASLVPSYGLVRKVLEKYGQPEMVWAPAVERNGHYQHNIVGEVARKAFQSITSYATYTSAGKTRTDHEVIPASGEYVRRKLQALACYDSQIDIEALGCRPHFMNDLREYYAS